MGSRPRNSIYIIIVLKTPMREYPGYSSRNITDLLARREHVTQLENQPPVTVLEVW